MWTPLALILVLDMDRQLLWTRSIVTFTCTEVLATGAPGILVRLSREFACLNLAGYLNDFWRFNLKTLQWAWLRGQAKADAVGTYGLQGVESPSNYPSSRYHHVAFFDLATSSMYMFGGNSLSTLTTGTSFVSRIGRII